MPLVEDGPPERQKLEAAWDSHCSVVGGRRCQVLPHASLRTFPVNRSAFSPRFIHKNILVPLVRVLRYILTFGSTA